MISMFHFSLIILILILLINLINTYNYYLIIKYIYKDFACKNSCRRNSLRQIYRFCYYKVNSPKLQGPGIIN